MDCAWSRIVVTSWQYSLSVVWWVSVALACAEPPDILRHEIPALVAAVDVDPDPDTVEVHLAVVRAEFEYIDRIQTRVIAYRDLANPDDAGRVPGPAIVAKRGDSIVLEVRNDLPVERTTLHLHGVRVPAGMDGNPAVSGTIDPGQTREFRFTAQDAGYFWYHPHVNASDHLELGLQGAFIVREPDAPTVPERWFMLDDLTLDQDGQVAAPPESSEAHTGRLGETLLVNGRTNGYIRARAGATERWHLVNSANARHFELSIDGLEMTVIGWDGGAIAEPYDVARIAIAPGERFDILLTFPVEPGENLEVMSLAVDRGYGLGATLEQTLFRVHLDERVDGMRVDAMDFARSIPRLPVDDSTPVRELRLRTDSDRPGGPLMYINDQSWPFNEPVPVTLDSMEIWRVHNLDAGPHPFHLHGMFFQVLSRGGVPATTRGWKDTVPINAHDIVDLAVRFDAPGHWMYHCQIPEHAEMGMMGDLLVSLP